MKKILITILSLSVFLIGGCNHLRPYQPNVQQGNILTEDMLKPLHLGMTKQEVENTIGLPVLVDNFDTNHWAYTFTFQSSGKRITKKNIDLFFQNDRLVNIKKN